MKIAIIITNQKNQRVLQAPETLDGQNSDNNALLAKIYDEANAIGEADSKACRATAWVIVQFWNPATGKIEIEQTFDYAPKHLTRPNRRTDIENQSHT